MSWVRTSRARKVGGAAERYWGEIAIARGRGGSGGAWVGLVAGVEGTVGCWGSRGGRTGFQEWREPGSVIIPHGVLAGDLVSRSGVTRGIARGIVVVLHTERTAGGLLTFGYCATFLRHIADSAATTSLRFAAVGKTPKNRGIVATVVGMARRCSAVLSRGASLTLSRMTLKLGPEGYLLPRALDSRPHGELTPGHLKVPNVSGSAAKRNSTGHLVGDPVCTGL